MSTFQRGKFIFLSKDYYDVAIDLIVWYYRPPPPPNFFDQIDLNKDGVLDKDEIERYFQDLGHEVPEQLWEMEDKNKDGVISWEEFSGPKGDSPPSVKEDL